MTVGQSAVDLDRQAINFHLLYENPIPFLASTIERKLTNRAYTPAQILLLLEEASQKMRLSIELALTAGLRAMELITISLPEYLPESLRRAWDERRFIGREEETRFVVHGKGGLCREVRLPKHLADQLMTTMRPFPITVEDRHVTHKSFFDLTHGANFSQQFFNLSNKVLGMSHGGHGLRHSFSQKRLRDLMCRGLSFEDALRILSNELGHFSSNNTFAYLRD
jgi:integrase